MISQVWLYYRFRLSFRDVGDLFAKRGVLVSYEPVRQSYGKFGPGHAWRLKRRRGRRQHASFGSSSRVNSENLSTGHRQTVQLTDRSFPWLLTTPDATPTIEWKRRIVQHDKENGRCDGSNRRITIHPHPHSESVPIGRHQLKSVHHRMLRARSFVTWKKVAAA